MEKLYGIVVVMAVMLAFIVIAAMITIHAPVTDDDAPPQGRVVGHDA
ncbi:MAG: hypothetical protein LBR16_02970 [Treponema sp.]|jgi:uncharacterized membrane protein|nr:hypothetical protein [Treponema sp.]